jgi:hypothetical protein
MPGNEVMLTARGVDRTDIETIAERLGGFGAVQTLTPFKANIEQQIINSIQIVFSAIPKEVYTEAGKLALSELVKILRSALAKKDGPYLCQEGFKFNGQEAKVTVSVPTKEAFDKAMETFDRQFERVADLVDRKALPKNTWILASEYSMGEGTYKLVVKTGSPGFKTVEYDEASGTWK